MSDFGSEIQVSESFSNHAVRSSLISYLDQSVFVVLDDSNFIGQFVSFDSFSNLTLLDAHEVMVSGNLYSTRALGVLVIRGDKISLIGELEGKENPWEAFVKDKKLMEKKTWTELRQFLRESEQKSVEI